VRYKKQIGYSPTRTHWSKAYYHIVIDYLGALYKFIDTDLTNYNLVFHPCWRSKKFAEQWTNIVVPELKNSVVYHKRLKNLEESIVIDSKISIDSDKMPHKHKENIVLFLRKKVNDYLIGIETKQNKMLLIKRTKIRCTNNFDELLILCKKYCDKLNLELDVFDDSENLGSVGEQLQRYRSSKIVIGQHGAGFINLLACLRNVHFIEFKSICRGPRGNKQDPVCFEVMANILGISHQCIQNNENQDIDLNQVNKYLEEVT